jgi:hypothetical protein
MRPRVQTPGLPEREEKKKQEILDFVFNAFKVNLVREVFCFALFLRPCFIMYARLTLDSLSCLHFPNTGSIDVYHHDQLRTNFLNDTESRNLDCGAKNRNVIYAQSNLQSYFLLLLQINSTLHGIIEESYSMVQVERMHSAPY